MQISFTRIQGQYVRYGRSSKVASNERLLARHRSKCQPLLKIAAPFFSAVIFSPFCADCSIRTPTPPRHDEDGRSGQKRCKLGRGGHHQ